MSSPENIILANEFDVKNIEYGEVKKLDNGGKMISVSYNKRPLVVQTCECIAPYGLNVYEGKDGESDTYSLDLSFRSMDTRPPLKEVYDMMSTIDNLNIKTCFENSVKWLGKKASSEEVVDALYTKIVKYSKDKDTGEPTDKYPPTFKIKLPYNGSPPAFKCSMFNSDHELMDIKETPLKGARVKALIQCTGIWLAGGKFGMTWRMVQMLVIPKAGFEGCCFRPVANHDITGEQDDDDIVVAPKTAKKSPPPPDDEEEEEEEEDEEEEEEEDEEPVIMAPRKRAVSTKKKP
jgi:hypothetical protein